jgi:hypothetical protein
VILFAFDLLELNWEVPKSHCATSGLPTLEERQRHQARTIAMIKSAI